MTENHVRGLMLPSEPGEWVDGWVDPDAALAYALATNDPNEVCRSGAKVAPLFTSSMILSPMFEAQRSLPDEAVVGATGWPHASHQILFYRPLLPGADVKIRARLHSTHQTRAGSLTAVEVDVAEPTGELIVRHYWVNMQTGGTLVEGPRGDPLPDHTFPAGARQHPLGSYAVAVDADQGFRYAGASGDREGHAVSDKVARAEGHPGKILQGMCTLALCSGGVVQCCVDGDPSRLRRLAARFDVE
jgi:acyl dehydratase